MSTPHKTPWLGRLKNGTGQDSQTWRGDTRKPPTGNFVIKRVLIDHLRKTGLIK